VKKFFVARKNSRSGDAEVVMICKLEDQIIIVCGDGSQKTRMQIATNDLIARKSFTTKFS
jgi:hypothetical protein